MIGVSAAFSRGAIIGAAIVVAVGLLGTPSPFAQNAPDYAALMAAPDRSDADRAADKRRDPVPFLAFAGLKPGMKVLDMGAGGGYSTELVARVIGPTGTAYGCRCEPLRGGLRKSATPFRAIAATAAE